MRLRGYIAAALLGTSLSTFAMLPAAAQDIHTTRQYDLPAQDLGSALRAVGRESGSEIIFQPETVEGKTAPVLSGAMTATEAVEHLLRGSGLVARIEGGAIIIRARAERRRVRPPSIPRSS
jgi:iron complex outermembrane recepter protein